MANNLVTTVKVQIGGEDHAIKGDASDQYIQQLAKLVDKRFQEIKERNPNLTRHRIAILVALNLADELEILKKEHQELIELMDEMH